MTQLGATPAQPPGTGDILVDMANALDTLELQVTSLRARLIAVTRCQEQATKDPGPIAAPVEASPLRKGLVDVVERIHATNRCLSRLHDSLDL